MANNDFKLDFGDVKGRWGPTGQSGPQAAAPAPAPAQAADDFDLMGNASMASTPAQNTGGFNFGPAAGGQPAPQQHPGSWPAQGGQQVGTMSSAKISGIFNPTGYPAQQMAPQGMQSGGFGQQYPQQHAMQGSGMQSSAFGGQQTPQGFATGNSSPFGSQGQTSMQSSNTSSPARRVATGRTLADGASFGSAATSKAATPSSARSQNRLVGLATGDLSAFDIHAGGETRKLAAKTAAAQRSSVPVDTQSRGAAMAFGGAAPSSSGGGSQGMQSVTAAHKAHLDSKLSDLLPGNFKKGGGSSFISGGSAPSSTKAGSRSVRAGASMAELAKTAAAKTGGNTPVMASPAAFGGMGMQQQQQQQGFGGMPGGFQQQQAHQQQQQQGGFGFGAPAQPNAAGFNFN